MCGKAWKEKIACCWMSTNLRRMAPIALDWYQPSENGKYVAYGTSPSGSEMSTLHIIETKTGTALPDTIERTRAAQHCVDRSTTLDFITRVIPRRATFPKGRRCTTGMCFITNWELIRKPIRRFLAKAATRRTGRA